MQGTKEVGISDSKVNGHSIHPVLNNIQGSGVATVQDHGKVLAIGDLIILFP